MKTYKVIASSISYFTLEIDAENEEQAWIDARNADGSEFDHDGDGDWVIIDVEEKTE
jgi:hypothetical protein